MGEAYVWKKFKLEKAILSVINSPLLCNFIDPKPLGPNNGSKAEPFHKKWVILYQDKRLWFCKILVQNVFHNHIMTSTRPLFHLIHLWFVHITEYNLYIPHTNKEHQLKAWTRNLKEQLKYLPTAVWNLILMVLLS